MNGQPQSLPHFLLKAHDDLLKSVRHASVHPSELEACICQFVFALYQIPGGEVELKRRATLVQKLCSPASNYAAARQAALRSFDEPTTDFPGAMQALSRLRTMDWTPIDITTVRSFSNMIPQVISAFLEEKPEAKDAFRKWERLCKDVVREAEHCQADGCQGLFLVHEAGGADPSGHAIAIREFMFSEKVAARRKALIPAADSLLDWVRDGAKPNDTQVGGTAQVKLPTKPKKSFERGEGRTKLIAALTKHHKYADGGCLNLEPVGNNELARLAHVNQATASAFFKKQFNGHGKYKKACADASKLAAALKLLNGEFAPHLLYGAKPTGESERHEE